MKYNHPPERPIEYQQWYQDPKDGGVRYIIGKNEYFFCPDQENDWFGVGKVFYYGSDEDFEILVIGTAKNLPDAWEVMKDHYFDLLKK